MDKRKLSGGIMAAVMCLMTACGSTGAPAPAPADTTAAETVAQTETDAETATSEETTAPEEQETEETTVTTEKKKKKKIEEDIPSLCEVFGGDFKVGTALTPADMISKNTMALAKKHFNDSMTIGNEMKPDYVLDKGACITMFKDTGNDEDPQVNFNQAKPLLDYCSENGIPMRVHTLVWHSQTPTWFFKEGYDDEGEWVSPEKMNIRMENYIRNYFAVLTEQYPDIEFYACDVVNEAWMEDGKPRKPGSREEGEGLSPWVKVYGDNSFIEYAFTYARKYAPEGCKLYYNDYNEYMNGKLAAIYEMAEDFKEKGIIDGIGMQSHLDVRHGSDAFPSVSMYDHALDMYSNLGLDIQVTELDAGVPADSGDKYFEAQAEYYHGIWKAIYAHRENVSAVILWGVTDDRSWRRDGQPLMFNKDFLAKPNFYSIIGIPDEPEDEPAEKSEGAAEGETSDTAETDESAAEENTEEAAAEETTEETAEETEKAE